MARLQVGVRHGNTFLWSREGRQPHTSRILYGAG